MFRINLINKPYNDISIVLVLNLFSHYLTEMTLDKCKNHFWNNKPSWSQCCNISVIPSVFLFPRGVTVLVFKAPQGTDTLWSLITVGVFYSLVLWLSFARCHSLRHSFCCQLSSTSLLYFSAVQTQKLRWQTWLSSTKAFMNYNKSFCLGLFPKVS